MTEQTKTALARSSEAKDWMVRARNVGCHPISCVPDSPPQSPALCSMRSVAGASNASLLIIVCVSHICVSANRCKRGGTGQMWSTKIKIYCLQNENLKYNNKIQKYQVQLAFRYTVPLNKKIQDQINKIFRPAVSTNISKASPITFGSVSSTPASYHHLSPHRSPLGVMSSPPSSCRVVDFFLAWWRRLPPRILALRPYFFCGIASLPVS